jgi:hypothetical protein
MIEHNIHRQMPRPSLEGGFARMVFLADRLPPQRHQVAFGFHLKFPRYSVAVM